MNKTAKYLRWKWTMITLFVITFAGQHPCIAGDWQVCSDNLDSLQQISATAADTKAKVLSAHKKFEAIKGQMQQCIRDPEQFDPHQDQCASLLNAYGVTKSAYDAALLQLRYELDEIARRSQSTQQACQEIGGDAMAASPAGSQEQSGSAEKGNAPAQDSGKRKTADGATEKKKTYNSTELEFCMRTMTETECRRRLNLE